VGVGGRRGAEGSADPHDTTAMSSWVVVTGKQMQVHDDSWGSVQSARNSWTHSQNHRQLLISIIFIQLARLTPE
jgi:hypothetical protein